MGYRGRREVAPTACRANKRVRRLISRRMRSSGLLVRMRRQYASGERWYIRDPGCRLGGRRQAQPRSFSITWTAFGSVQKFFRTLDQATASVCRTCG